MSTQYPNVPELSEEELYKQSLNIFARKVQEINIEWANQLLKSMDFTPHKYSKEDILLMLQNPDRNEDKLRQVHQHLYSSNNYYKRLINHFSTILTYDYILTPVNVDIEDAKTPRFKKAYKKALQLTELLNIKDEFSKINKILIGEDVGYFYVRETEYGITLQRMPSNYCKLIDKNNICYQYAIDLRFFDKQGVDITKYDKSLQNAYNAWREAKRSKSYYYVLPIDIAPAFKFEEVINIITPVFSGIFADALNIEDYKSLMKTKSVIDNFKLLQQRIPLDNEKKPTMELGEALIFHENLKANVPSGVGVNTSPMEVEAINLTNNSGNSIETLTGVAEGQFYSSAGTSEMLFNSNKSGSIGMAYTVQTDEDMMLPLYRQFERWINYYLSVKISGTIKFKVIFPDITRFNKKDRQTEFLANAQYGLPKTFLNIGYGLSPNEFISVLSMEKGLDFTNTYLDSPLLSSYTQNTNEATDKGGRPQKSETDLSDNGAISKDNQK